MERARGCGCGTLAAASKGGGGVVAALIGLVVGAFLGTLHAPSWPPLACPASPPPRVWNCSGWRGLWRCSSL